MPKNKPEFGNLYEEYENIDSIRNDPDLGAMAFAADMSEADLANLILKRFAIIKAVFEKDVSISFQHHDKIENVPLVNTNSNQALKYGDFLTDRSGPKFGGYLEENIGNQYLVNDQAAFEKSRNDIVQSRIQETREKFPDMKNEKKLELAASVFNKAHRTQRKLSDFDLTNSGLSPFYQSIHKALNQELKTQVPPELAKSVADTLWKVGGPVDVGLIKKIMGDENHPPQSNLDYQTIVEANVNKQYKDTGEYSHFLVDGPGKSLFESDIGLPNIEGRKTAAEADTGYGLGIPFMGTEVRADPKTGKLHLTTQLVQDHRNGKISEDELKTFFPGEDLHEILHHEGRFEIGDIICDSSPDLEHAFSSEKNCQVSSTKVAELVGADKWQQALATAGVNQGIPTEQQFNNAVDTLMDTHADNSAVHDELASIKNTFNQDQEFIKAASLFEESAKKDAQSQIFKLEGHAKLVALERDAKNLKKMAEITTDPNLKKSYQQDYEKVSQQITSTSRSTKKKLIGNISDVEPYIKGAVDKTQASDPQIQSQAKAHLQISQLSLMLNSSRWGINEKNYSSIGQGEQIDPKAFQQSINNRSYSYDPNVAGPRNAVGWNNISMDEATSRLRNYNEGMNVVWGGIRNQGAYFEKMGDYKNILREIDEVQSKINKSPQKAEWNSLHEQKSQKQAELQAVKIQLKNDKSPELQAKRDALKSEVDGLSKKIAASPIQSLVDERAYKRIEAEHKKGEFHAFLKNHIQENFPELHQKITTFNPTEQGQEQFFSALTNQAESAILFGNKREANKSAKIEKLAQLAETPAAEVIPARTVREKISTFEDKTSKSSTTTAPDRSSLPLSGYKLFQEKGKQADKSSPAENNPSNSRTPPKMGA